MVVLNSNFRFPVSLQPNAVDFWYFKIQFQIGKSAKVLNIEGKLKNIERLENFNFRSNSLQLTCWHWCSTIQFPMFIEYFYSVANTCAVFKKSVLSYIRKISSIYLCPHTLKIHLLFRITNRVYRATKIKCTQKCT